MLIDVLQVSSGQDREWSASLRICNHLIHQCHRCYPLGALFHSDLPQLWVVYARQELVALSLLLRVLAISLGLSRVKASWIRCVWLFILWGLTPRVAKLLLRSPSFFLLKLILYPVDTSPPIMLPRQVVAVIVVSSLVDLASLPTTSFIRLVSRAFFGLVFEETTHMWLLIPTLFAVAFLFLDKYKN